MINLPTSSPDNTNFRSKRKLVSTAVSPRQKRKRTTKKTVQFSAGTKKHDGLSPTRQLLNDLVWQYFHSHGSIRTPKDLLVFMASRTRLLPAVITLIQDLVLRMSRARAPQMTPVLPAGGGRVMVLPVSKMGSVMLLLRLCSVTRNLLLQIYERRRSHEFLAALRQTSPGNESHVNETFRCDAARLDMSARISASNAVCVVK